MLSPGLATPSAGSVMFEGKDVAGDVPDGVGVVFQEDASFPWLTVYDNAAFSLRRGGVSSAEISERVRIRWHSPVLPRSRRPIRPNFPAACASGFASHGPL